MRLIDADALTKVLRIQEDEWGTPDETWMPESDYGRVIKSMPTIDPVKHGRWVPLYDDVWECSECEQAEQFAENIESTSRYCPNCGAIMDADGK